MSKKEKRPTVRSIAYAWAKSKGKGSMFTCHDLGDVLVIQKALGFTWTMKYKLKGNKKKK